MPGPGAGKKKLEWGAVECLANWDNGFVHQLLPPSRKGDQHGKSKQSSWEAKPRTFSSIHKEGQTRVQACMERSLGIQACQQMVTELHQALATALADDRRANEAGERARILSRALALREALQLMDPTLSALTEQHKAAAVAAAAKEDKQVPAPESPAGSKQPAMHDTTQTPDAHKNKSVRLLRSSNEAEADATPDECILAVCLMLAALFEGSPFMQGDIRRRIFTDFTMLKRHFREDPLPVLHGKTGPLTELFGAVRDMDRRGSLQNLVGVLFEDWRVYSRVDPVILADELDVEVMTLTCEGPIGKFACKLRTLVTISLLHSRLIEDLFKARFAGRRPPMTQMEAMSLSDPLDLIDFTEALARNMPFKHTDGSKLYYAWMYSPEVNAPPEVWERILGPGHNRCPTMYDDVQAPDTVITQSPAHDHDYVLDVEQAMQHNFASCSSQGVVAFPFADDLLGAYLRKLQEERQQRQQKQKRPADHNKANGLEAGEHVQQQRQKQARVHLPGDGPPTPTAAHPGVRGPAEMDSSDVSRAAIGDGNGSSEPRTQTAAAGPQEVKPARDKLQLSGMQAVGPGAAEEVQVKQEGYAGQQESKPLAPHRQAEPHSQHNHPEGPCDAACCVSRHPVVSTAKDVKMANGHEHGGPAPAPAPAPLQAASAAGATAVATVTTATAAAAGAGLGIQAANGRPSGAHAVPVRAAAAAAAAAIAAQAQMERTSSQPSDKKQVDQKQQHSQPQEAPPTPVKQVTPIHNAEETGKLSLPLGVFLVGIICSGAFTNTQVHVEDLLLMSININIFGAPKVWWWLPRESVHGFKAYAERMTEGGRGELYTKSISPFLTDREERPPEQVLPLQKLLELGAKRTIQMPGMGIWTMPGYAFHFTVSLGFNIAESANMFLELGGWTLEKLWLHRPLEQYPEEEDDMARYMRDTGVAAKLKLPQRSPLPAVEVQKALEARITPATVSSEDGMGILLRSVTQDVVRYASYQLPIPEQPFTKPEGPPPSVFATPMSVDCS